MNRQQLIKKIKQTPSDREGLHQALTDYATKHAGTEADLDEELEAAAIEEIALSRAIDEGLDSPSVKRDEVIAILST